MAGSNRSKYVLGERIAQGGMAEIYLGKIVGSEGFTRLCAFKKVLPNFAEDAEFMEMFRNEAMVAKQLQNKNIVQVYDFESDPDHGAMLVMEYVDGQDLRSILRESERARQKIPVELAVYIAAESLNGLGFAHVSVDISGKSLGIIHRDVSPQNILVSFEGDVKITDFGIAKVQSNASQTRAGVLKGKFRYMAPEQAKGETIDPRCDIFAMGIVLYEMLTMTRLFKGDDDFQILQAVRDCKVRPPNEIKGVSIPPELESIVLKLLARNPAERYQSSRDAVKDLTRFLYSFRKDFFPGELAEFMRNLFSAKVEAARDRMRSTLALPVETRETNNMPASFAAAILQAQKDNPTSREQEHQPMPFFLGPNAAPINSTSENSSDKIVLDGHGSHVAQHSRAPNRGNESFEVRSTTKSMRSSTSTAMRNERLFNQNRSRKTSSLLSSEKIFVMFFVLFLVAGGVFYSALRQRTIRFPSIIEIKSIMESQRKVKIRVDGQPFQGGAWIDLPVQIQFEWGAHSILVSKPGFRDQKISFNAPIIGNTLFGTSKVEGVVLGKDAPLANILILTEPEGARVSIDNDQFIGLSGKQIEFVPVGRRYKIRIEHPRCQAFHGEVEIPSAAAGEIFTKQFPLRGCH